MNVIFGSKTRGNTAGLRSALLVAGLALVVAGCSESADTDYPEITTVDVPEPEPVITCDTPPENGAVLSRDASRGTGPHSVSIVNGSAGNTIVNVRDGASNDLVLSFFVAESQSAGVGDIPNGKYRIQYASGGELGEDCRNFAVLGGASEDPEIVDFPAGSAMELSYELQPVLNGNFEGQSIDPEAFAAD